MNDIKQSIVKIQCGAKTGTGFAITPNLVVTCKHTVNDQYGKEVILEYFDPEKNVFSITGNDIRFPINSSDVAYITLPEKNVYTL
jgi:V8-like Glu-specific endopeptidase